MATGDPVRELSEELTCPICLEYFSDPVILTECGHHFCRDCLTRSWGESETAEASCPVCKQTARTRDLRPNRQLANVVEIAKRLSLHGGEAEERICEKHREPLKLFCQTDEILICTVCDRSKEHKNHEVIPKKNAEKASQEHKDKIFNCLETLRTERENVLVYIADAEGKSQKMLKRTKSGREKVVAEFRTLHHFLNEQEKNLLSQIKETEKEIRRKRDEYLARLSEELSSLESLIQEMEEKSQQSVTELLQDVRGTLQKYEKKETFVNPEDFLLKLKPRVHDCCYNPFLRIAMRQFKVSLRPSSTPPCGSAAHPLTCFSSTASANCLPL
ncbi:PREDICTED: zinc finger protein RFP-like [Gekko japonicus]|uniref:Zinc finger protein RFP-like n=1 Tax=Gekko japonicus TaxID=146911 RepID=A0ABM1KJ36_GEKJA|nr:PREDICTED: zinc finger protein RFP-like [Gekko japonicus]